jgi:hypothetical protein
MILITSAAYVTSDFVSEIGKIPPSFLPVGNKRLYKYQLDFFKDLTGDIYLSIPSDYKMQKSDRDYLKSQNVHILHVPVGLTLGQSILYCWNATGKVYESLRILHGDTFFTDLKINGLDTISVDFNNGYYERAVVAEGRGDKRIYTDLVGESESVISGYFSFSQPQVLFKGIIESNNDFIKGLAYYDQNIALKKVTQNGWLDLDILIVFFNQGPISPRNESLMISISLLSSQKRAV